MVNGFGTCYRLCEIGMFSEWNLNEKLKKKMNFAELGQKKYLVR